MSGLENINFLIAVLLSTQNILDKKIITILLVKSLLFLYPWAYQCCVMHILTPDRL